MARIFSVVPSDRTEGNELKLEHRKFHPTIRKNSEGNSPRTSCLERLWSVFSLEILKTCMDTFLCDLL